MNPDGAGAAGRKFVEPGNRKAKALAKVGKILAVAKALDEPIRRRQQGGKAHQNAVEKIHSM